MSSSGGWNLRGHFRILPTTPMCGMDMLTSIFKLIASSTLTNKAEAGPRGGLLQEAQYVATFLVWHSQVVVVSRAIGLTLYGERFNAFAEIVQGCNLS